MFLSSIGRAFFNAKGVFIDFTPAPPNIFVGKPKKIAKIVFSSLYYTRFIKRAASSNPYDVAGALIAGVACDKIYRQPLKKIVLKGFQANTKQPTGYIRLNERHLSKPKKTWFSGPGKIQVQIIYHEGNKRGAHIDVHFSNGTSFVIDVRNKPIAKDIKLNSDNKLTQKSIDILMKHIRDEFDGNGHGSRIFQNFDHNPEEAQMEWFGHEESPDGYGSGRIRQVIHSSECHIMWHNKDSAGQATSLYIPGISPDRYVYFHQLYKNTDVAKMGFKAFKTPKFEDRLHLTMVDETKFKENTVDRLNTFKYDGASAYIEVSKHGTRVFSPRISSKTDHRIEYTGKMPTDMINTTSDVTYKGMGELLFKRNGKYLSATEIGGLLNGHTLIPDNIETEYRLYRVDSVGRSDVRGLEYMDNRNICGSVAGLFSSTVKLPEFITVSEAKRLGAEGVVGIPEGGNVFNGYKFKFRDNYDDWKIISIDFFNTKKGSIGGVIKAVDEKGKVFNMGGGQMGDHAFCQDMIDHPKKYIGKTMRVQGFRGHSGRAAKFVDFHLDK